VGRDSVEPSQSKIQNPKSKIGTPPSAYFGTPEKIALALAVAQRWLGTPFAPRTRVRGAGVDCVQLAGAFYIETGLVTHFTPPPYHLDAGAHRETSQVIEYVEALPDKLWLFWASDGRDNKEMPPVIIGDLLGFKFGRVIHHVGMVVADASIGRPTEFIHVFRGGVVCASPLDDPSWLARLAAVYRPLAPRAVPSAQSVIGGASGPGRDGPPGRPLSSDNGAPSGRALPERPIAPRLSNHQSPITNHQSRFSP